MHAVKERKISAREIVTVVSIFAFFASFIAVLVNLQIVQGEAYADKVNSVSSQTVKIKAARGEILDRNGNPLITNRQGNSIIFDSANFPAASVIEQRVEIIAGLIKLFEANGVPWKDNLPLVFTPEGQIAFAENRESDIANMKSKDMLNLNDYATAQHCFNALIERYKLEQYTPQEARKIASVCYEMKRLVFSIPNPYTFAEDVPGELVAKIKENSAFYRGVEVEIVPYRQYADGTLAPHVLGMIGAINREEYEKLKDSGYGINDTIGKNGIEGALESELRGTDGVKTVTTDSEGKTTAEITTPPVQGNAVILTIDAKIQKIAQDTLKKVLTETSTPVPSAGAVVVLNCNTGEILASASYPTYDISTYSKKFAELSKATGSPLWDRALQNAYEAGSTMKLGLAITGLEEGIITRDTHRYCNGRYELEGSVFVCKQSHPNRNLSVVTAIKDSCNTFFYDLGNKLGISTINRYRTMFGLGQKTGVEIGDAAGNLDSPEYRLSIGQKWFDGYTVQSAIGEAENYFTPIQLANYCSVIANGGTLYQPHFVRSVKSYDFSKTILDKEAVVKWETGFSKNSFDIVHEGMRLIGTSGASAIAFSKLPFQVAAKTGTSQISRNINGVPTITNDGIYVCFAPYDKPELAVALVGEGFRLSAPLANVVKDVFEYYFSNTAKAAPPQAENTLLG